MTYAEHSHHEAPLGGLDGYKISPEAWNWIIGQFRWRAIQWLRGRDRF